MCLQMMMVLVLVLVLMLMLMSPRGHDHASVRREVWHCLDYFRDSSSTSTTGRPLLVLLLLLEAVELSHDVTA